MDNPFRLPLRRRFAIVIPWLAACCVCWIAFFAYLFWVSNSGGKPHQAVTLGILLLSAIFPAIGISRFHREEDRWIAERAGRFCCACGYNLTGNTSGICPECGTLTRTPSSGQGRRD